MRILVVDAFGKGSVGRRDFRKLSKAVRKTLSKLKVEFGDAHITTLLLKELKQVVFDESSAFPDPDAIGRFAAFDIVIMDGDALLLPWMPKACPARVLVKMCLASGKSLFCGQFAAQVLVYVLSTGGRNLAVVNGAGKGSSIAALRAKETTPSMRGTASSIGSARGGGASRRNVSPRAAARAARVARRGVAASKGEGGEQVFLDNLSGDIYTQDGAEWVASGNVGIYLHRGRTEHSRWGKGSGGGGGDLNEVVCRIRKRQIGHWSLRNVPRQFSTGRSGRWLIQEAASRSSAARYVVLAERNANPRAAPLLVEVGCALGADFHLTETWPQTSRIFENFVRHRCTIMMNATGRSQEHELLLRSAPPMRTGLAKPVAPAQLAPVVPPTAAARAKNAAAVGATAPQTATGAGPATATKSHAKTTAATAQTARRPQTSPSKLGGRGGAGAPMSGSPRQRQRQRQRRQQPLTSHPLPHSSSRPRVAPSTGSVCLAPRTNALDGASKSHVDSLVPLTTINQGTTALFPTSRVHVTARQAWASGRRGATKQRGGAAGAGWGARAMATARPMRPTSTQSSPVPMVSSPRGDALGQNGGGGGVVRGSPAELRRRVSESQLAKGEEGEGDDARIVQRPRSGRSPYSSWNRRFKEHDGRTVAPISIGTKYTTPWEKAVADERESKAKRVTDKPFYRHSGLASALEVRGAGGSAGSAGGRASSAFAPVAAGGTGEYLHRGRVERDKFVDPKGWF